jgi:glycosyltransferase involved in cell wall biosynthesis
MALKILRATDDETLGGPLRPWLAGNADEAFARLGSPDAGKHAEEATQVVSLALAADASHAARIGAALVRWDDDIAAYRITREAAEEIIDALPQIGVRRWMPRAVALVELVRPWLEARPAEPVLLNYLGVALYGLQEPAAALDILLAAGALDPKLENLQGNIAAARAARRKSSKFVLAAPQRVAIDRLRPWVKGVPARAAAVAPAQDVSISLCMIVRDEEEMLGACLESCRDGVDEMVIVDTGSTDRTVEIAESFGARVLHFPWNGSFSDARNHGIDAATGTHVLWLDADEQLEAGDAARLRDLARQTWREAHWLVETNFTGQEEVGTAANHLALRLWRHRDAYRFSGAIHEQIRISMPVDLPERFAISELRIRHYGYLKARIEAKGKHERNLSLLERELERNPRSAFTHFNIGTEYVALDDMPRAAQFLEQALAILRNEPAWHELAYASLLVMRLIGVRRRLGQLVEADSLAAELLTVWPRFTDLYFERGLCARERGDRDEARRLFEHCLKMGDAPARFAGMSGRGSILALAALAALAIDEADYEDAVIWLRRSLAEYPDYLPAGFDLATAMLGAPDADADAVLADLEPMGNDSGTWYMLLGTAFYERGHVTQAERLFRDALTRNGGLVAARVGLAEALLSQHRYADLAPEPLDLARGTVAATALARIRALAAILAGDRAAAADPLDVLEHDGEPGERALLERAGAVLGGDDGPPLDAASGPAALRLLEALARLEEFDAFARCVPLVEEAIGDRVTAAVALGELYLARGFYQLAASTALDAIDAGGPAARPLAILGKAAVAEGLFDDAVPVLRESLALDPTQAAVRRLLDDLAARDAA